MSKIRVGVIVKDISFQERLCEAVKRVPEMSVGCIIRSTEELRAAVSRSEQAASDIILFENHQDVDVVQEIEFLLNKFHDLLIIVLGNDNDKEDALDVIKAGAHSYIDIKTPLNELIKSIFTVYKGGAVLTPKVTRDLIALVSKPVQSEIFSKLTARQMDIIRGISEGLSYKLIADKYGISIDTVRSHIKRIYKLLNVHSKIEVVNMYRNMQ